MGEKQMKNGNLNMLKTEITRLALAIGLLLGLALFVSSCDHVVKTDEFSTYVSGVITDSLTKAPIARAWFGVPASAADTVSDDPAHFFRLYADSAGRYSLATFGGINRQVYAGKVGYKTKSRTLPATVGTMRNIDFELVKDSM
jgi:hypothetical protein